MEQTLRWVKAPQQDRSRKTMVALLDAAEVLLEEGSFDTVGVADIARRAGSSVGAFYGRFENKRALLRALHSRYCREALATIQSAMRPETWDDAPTRDMLAALCAFAAEDYKRRPGLRRSFLRLLHEDAEVRRAATSMSRDSVAAVRTLFRIRASDIDHPDLDMAAEMSHRMLFAMLDRELLFYGAPPSSGPNFEQVRGESARMLVRYLGVAE